MRSWDGEPKEKWTRVIETIIKIIMDHRYHQDNCHSFHHHHYDHSQDYDQYSYLGNPHDQVMRAEGAGGKWNRVMKRQGEVVSLKINRTTHQSFSYCSNSIHRLETFLKIGSFPITDDQGYITACSGKKRRRRWREVVQGDEEKRRE